VTDELYPAFIGLIRRELHVEPGCDALDELAARLSPEDLAHKPPYRAPGIVRLRRALRRLREHKVPVDSIEQFADDLRFLRLFSPDEPVLSPTATRRLLADVMRGDKPAPQPRSGRPSLASKVVPLRRKKEKA
jgi:hypothetical protein